MLTETDVEISRPSLREAAFGIAPECWPLPAAHSPYELWLRAGSCRAGRYASARSDLAALRRQQTYGPTASLAHSAHASFSANWADIGWLEDGMVAHWRSPGTGGTIRGLPKRQMTRWSGWLPMRWGRAAQGSRAIPRMCEGPVRGRAHRPRLKIRMAWVSAELAMAG